MSKSELRAVDNTAKKSRRKKKRRTLDVSDSSSSESDSEIETKPDQRQEAIEVDNDIELTDDESNNFTEKGPDKISGAEQWKDETRDELNSIPFTKTDLTNKNDFNQKSNSNENGVQDSLDLKKVRETIEEDQKKMKKIGEANLKNDYLGLIFENYGEDINSLREAPDFTNKSLVILANVLKEGSAMFDVETLKTMLDTK
ncbi:hypothetical protein HG535_0F04820 [Zygotorulaspora mrakii]|uniref:Ribosome assembly protein 3 n=1 Tax=Zygotorulaspora mrakii TaxID=42260 RepID=A0A7H9B5U9_ZYGMR|nr:uncharacterized protein HG535_0F04820 [Zygotorulaspora mrakii]QLG73970.1 hypothetical protein HG535_0F04820 [Zygotorulaspora mrakii]